MSASDKPSASQHPETSGDHNDVTVGVEPPTTPASLEGSVLGDYTVLELIGTGGAGHVYKARHHHMGRTVALKVLSHAVVPDSRQLKRFRREVQTAAKLLHPNIVTAFDAGEFEGTFFLAMEHVDGQLLADLVASPEPMPIVEAADCLLQTARGLAYAHAQGVIHRDIKPQNLMRDRTGTIKILDMGLARLHTISPQSDESEAHLEVTEHGTIIGTVGYISPEQINSAPQVDLRADIYSLGCTFVFLLTGQPPYTGSMMQTLIDHVHAPVPRLSDLRHDVSADLEAVVQRMLAKNPDDRQTDMDEVITELSAAVQMSVEGVASAMSGTPAGNSGAATTAEDASASAHQVLGFDLGTSRATLATMGTDAMPEIVPGPDGSPSTASTVVFESGMLQIGETASSCDIPTSSPRRVAQTVDRLTCRLGATPRSFELGDQQVPAAAVCAAIVDRLGRAARDRVGDFSRVIYTVPGCFGDVRRRAFQDVYAIASLDAHAGINASTAVAIHFAFLHGWLNPQRKSAPQTLLLFRYGAGSFDATVYRIANQTVEALSIAGDPLLGGCVWDDRLANNVALQFQKEHGVDVAADPASMAAIRQQCEQAKIALSVEQSRVPVKIRLNNLSLEGTLSHGFLRKMGQDLLQRAKRLTDEALASAELGWQDLDHVVLAGGTSHMPVVREMVEAWPGARERCSYAESDAAAKGAALYAQILDTGSQPTLNCQIQEVSSRNVGILTIDPQTGKKSAQIVIARNTPLPTSAKTTLKTTQRGQASISFEVFERSSASTKTASLIGAGEIAGLPPGLSVGTPISLEVQLSRGGTVSLAFESIATGRSCAPRFHRHELIPPDEQARWRRWLDERQRPRSERSLQATAVEISDEAMAHLRRLREAQEITDLHLGLRISGIGPQGFTYETAFLRDSDLSPTDYLEDHGELAVAIPALHVDNLRGTVLDLNADGGLVMRNPNAPSLDWGDGEIQLSGTTAEKLQQLIESRINPAVAAHDGYVRFEAFEGQAARLEMGGGCGGDGLVARTLRQAVQHEILRSLPEIKQVLEATSQPHTDAQE